MILKLYGECALSYSYAYAYAYAYPSLMQVGDDILKQKQLIEAVASQYSAAKKTQSVEDELHAEVAELVLVGVIDMLRMISLQQGVNARKQGRLPHELKTSYHRGFYSRTCVLHNFKNLHMSFG